MSDWQWQSRDFSQVKPESKTSAQVYSSWAAPPSYIYKTLCTKEMTTDRENWWESIGTRRDVGMPGPSMVITRGDPCLAVYKFLWTCPFKCLLHVGCWVWVTVTPRVEFQAHVSICLKEADCSDLLTDIDKCLLEADAQTLSTKGSVHWLKPVLSRNWVDSSLVCALTCTRDTASNQNTADPFDLVIPFLPGNVYVNISSAISLKLCMNPHLHCFPLVCMSWRLCT